ncbi:hypothetical protein ES288_D10G207400v1 [Gossypium darwinii]|uniref:Uncharacterized protein n=1 Tax=Gossypium darwinii TaxID=34276 RepID=A0A5D2B2V8_GOSDA|nr:hypothetical protein ES288_D10G207400v1 [Gossypium darwinii]
MQFQYLPRHTIKLITLKRLAGLDALAIIEERFGRGSSTYHKKPAPYQYYQEPCEPYFRIYRPPASTEAMSCRRQEGS